jgi:hypothetical protein
VTAVGGIGEGMSDQHEDAYCELSFSPNVSLVSTVRRFVSSFYVQVLSDAEATSKLALATHELLENAVRYSEDGHTSIRIGVRREGPRIAVHIRTKNRANASHVETLKQMLAEAAAAKDPDTHYQALMRRSAKRTDGSGLGLGRIRAETDMALAVAIEGDMVELQASAHFDTKRPT